MSAALFVVEFCLLLLFVVVMFSLGAFSTWFFGEMVQAMLHRLAHLWH